MLNDIESSEDIKRLVDSFYGKVRNDKTIGFFFNEVINVDWENHLPKMYSFWSSVVFDTNDFVGNPMKAHIQVNGKEKMEGKHFEQWLKLWKETLSENFSGPNAHKAFIRAQSIATMIQVKLSYQ